MVAGRIGLAIPSNTVRKFLSVGPSHAWLGVTLQPVLVPRRNGNAFGLVVLEVEPASPSAQASLLPGDILIGTEEPPFHSLEDCANALAAGGPRLVRLEGRRGEYGRV